MKLSIIIPAYNVENYIAKTIESLQKMSGSFDYEIIIINDGSTDATRQIIERYKKKNDNIIIFNIDNKGVSNARNIGIKNSSGELITFVDGDDTVDPLFFETAIREMDNREYDFVQFNYRIVCPNSIQYEQFVIQEREINSKEEMLKAFFSKKKTIHNAVWGKVFRKTTIGSIRFDETINVAEDLKFIFEVLQRATCIKLVPDVGYNYYQRSSSAMHTNLRKNEDKLKVLDYCKTIVKNNETLRLIERHQLITLLAMYDASDNSSSIRKHIRKRLVGLDLKELKKLVDRNTYIKAVLISRVSPLYDAVMTRKSKKYE